MTKGRQRKTREIVLVNQLVNGKDRIRTEVHWSASSHLLTKFQPEDHTTHRLLRHLAGGGGVGGGGRR